VSISQAPFPPARTTRMIRVAVIHKRNEWGFAPGRTDVPSRYVVRELSEALHHCYFTKAHLAPYVVEGLELGQKQCRITKAGIDLFIEKTGKRAFTEAFFCDVDNPGHGVWTDELFARAREQDRSLPSLSTAGVYYTEHGRRIVQPLAEPLDARDTEPHLAGWLRRLEGEGLAVDWRCRDWTRLYKLPNVPPYRRSRCIDLERMVPIELPELPPQQAPITPATSSRARSARPTIEAWTATVPAVWRPLAEALAPAVASVETEWHSLFMALAGAMLARRVPPEHVPAIQHAISVLTAKDDRTEDRVLAAKTTVERWTRRLPTTGYASLERDWPSVALALDRALASRSERRMHEQLASAPAAAPSGVEETARALEDAIRNAPDGLTLIQAGCGIGKTRAAERVAAARADKPYATPNAERVRAPPQSKTSISVDKHALAQQVVRHLHVLGTEAAWHHGPLAKRNEDGTPVCRLAEVAEPLVAGGQPMQWLLCRGRDIEPCPFFDGCSARSGREGPDHPRVNVGPHALLAALDGEAGASGLLVIDEPPPLLETLTFTSADFATTFGAFDCFDGAYGAALRPALEAIGAWLATGPPADEATTVEAVVTTYTDVVTPAVLQQARRSSATPAGDPVECARAAPVPKEGPPAPPLRWEYVVLSRKNAGQAQRIGAASRLLRAVHHALTSETQVAVRLERRGDRRVLHLTRVREAFVEALKRDGSVIVLDANVDVWAPVYRKVVGYERPILRFHARDGAPIERSVFRLTSATRSAWMKEGKLVLAPSLRTAVRTAIEWAEERPGNNVLAIIAIHVVELALRAARSPGDASVEEAWVAAGQSRSMLAEVREEFGPMLRRWPGEVLFGHYGALRGLDAMAEADNLATIGDPWVNIDQVRHECAFLGLTDWEERLTAMCRAELEQAHGRLRTVHRTRPARALHVGAVVPGGVGWNEESVAVRRSTGGLAKRSPDQGDDELLAEALRVAGSVSALARAVRCERKTLQRYLSGERALAPEVRESLRCVLGGSTSKRRDGASGRSVYLLL